MQAYFHKRNISYKHYICNTMKNECKLNGLEWHTTRTFCFRSSDLLEFFKKICLAINYHLVIKYNVIIKLRSSSHGDKYCL